MIVVPNYPHFNDSVLPVIETVNSWIGLERGKHWNYVGQRHDLEYWNGCTDHVYSSENPILGATKCRAWIDEAAFQPYQAFLDTMARVRHPSFPNQIQVDTTGEGRDNWVTQVFWRDHLTEDDIRLSDVAFEADRETGGRYVAMVARTIDNPHGGQRFYEKMIRLYGEGSAEAKRYLEGDPLITRDGLVYPMWDRAVHVVPEDRWPTKVTEIVCGADFGGAEPSSMHPLGVDGQGRYYLMDEFYKPSDPVELAREAQNLARQYRIRSFPTDHDPSWTREFRALGLPSQRADKRMHGPGLTSGITLMQTVLRKRDAQGRPMFMVSPKCKHFIREVEGYVWKKNRDGTHEEPVDKNNHACDEVRYAIKQIYRLGWDPDLRIAPVYTGKAIETRRVA